MEVINSVIIKSMWSSRDIGWEFVESLGASGGILTMWDSSIISVIQVIKGRFSLSIKYLSLSNQIFWITNVYGPCGYSERKLIWPELSALTAEAWCLGGDFNITRWAHERSPFGRNTRSMHHFNKFIAAVNLTELPLQNGRFTWSMDGSSLSRSLLDRVLYKQRLG